jgi:hypothetical protein
MLILDNLLLSPLLWIFREINESVQKEQAGEAEAVTRALSELYMKLDAGAITEQEFEAEESVLLDRLDAISERDDAQAADSDGDEEEADDSDEDDGDEEDEDEDEDDGDDEEEEEDDDEEEDEQENIETQVADLTPHDAGKR